MAHILVIDDEAPMRTMLRDLLERAGFRVTDAPDGETGIDLYRQEPADLAIVDIVMPGKEGLEVIRELKREFPDIRIIAISGGGWRRTPDYLDHAGEFGALRAFPKPFDPKELLEAVGELLDQDSSDTGSRR